MDLQPGTVFEQKYEIRRVIATGGMGAVYEALHLYTLETVALKVLSASANNRIAERRFKLEVSVGAKVDHPGIVQVFDAGTDAAGRFYLTMELLRGADFCELLDDSKRTTRAIAWHLLDALDVVRAAHDAGVVHRDIKPENLYLERLEDGAERVRLLDFGIARDLGQARATATGSTLGTALYMAPEQAVDSKAVCRATDVWAFGVILYELFAGAPPFGGETAHAVIIDAVTKPHLPLADLRPELPASLTAVVERCLQKSPTDRFQDAGELRHALAASLAEVDDLERPVRVARVRTQNSTDDAEHAPPSWPAAPTLSEQGRHPGAMTQSWPVRSAPKIVLGSLLAAAVATAAVIGMGSGEPAEEPAPIATGSTIEPPPEPSSPARTEGDGLIAAEPAEAHPPSDPAPEDPSEGPSTRVVAEERAEVAASPPRRRRARRRRAADRATLARPRPPATKAPGQRTSPENEAPPPEPPPARTTSTSGSPPVLQGVTDFDSQADRLRR